VLYTGYGSVLFFCFIRYVNGLTGISRLTGINGG